MKISKKTKFLIIIFVLLALVIAFLGYIFLSKDTDDAIPSSAQPVSSTTQSEVPGNIAKTFKFTEPEIRKIIIDLSKTRFGDDAFVIPLSLDGPSQVEIEGKKRYVYIYVADSLSKQEDVDDIKGLYHVDPVTGEIFDNGNGKMEKVQLEEE